MINCPLCHRDTDLVNDHHFVPRAKGGKEKTSICLPCHNTIHDLFTNNELRDIYNTPGALKGHEGFRKYLKWIRKKPADFMPCFKAKK